MNYKFEVLTVRDISFTDQSGRQVEGMQLWLICESQEQSWNGWEVLKVWIDGKSKLVSDVQQLRRGDHVQVNFNRRGKPEIITLL